MPALGWFYRQAGGSRAVNVFQSAFRMPPTVVVGVAKYREQPCLKVASRFELIAGTPSFLKRVLNQVISVGPPAGQENGISPDRRGLTDEKGFERGQYRPECKPTFGQVRFASQYSFSLAVRFLLFVNLLSLR